MTKPERALLIAATTAALAAACGVSYVVGVTRAAAAHAADCTTFYKAIQTPAGLVMFPQTVCLSDPAPAASKATSGAQPAPASKPAKDAWKFSA
jgi:hypothetical protein